MDEIIVVRNEHPSDRDCWVLQHAASLGDSLSGYSDQVIVDDAGERCGAARARNNGWRRSRHEWVFFLDDDVEVGSDFLSQVRDAIRHAREAGVITFRVCSSGGEWNDLVAATISLDRGEDIRRTENQRFQLRNVWILGVGAALLVRRDVLMRIGGFKDHLGAGLPKGGAEDMELLWHASRHTSLVYRGDISILHTDVVSLQDVGSKFGQYGRAIANLGAHEKSAAGFLMVTDYCLHIISAVAGYLCRTPLPWRHRSELAAAAVRAVLTTASSYVSTVMSDRRGQVLCSDCSHQ